MIYMSVNMLFYACTLWLGFKSILVLSGTGNGIAKILEGYDPVTAALSIIIGKFRFLNQ